MNKTERILFEEEKSLMEEEKEMVYSITYYDDENEQYGVIFDDFEDVIDYVCKLFGWRHINILRFNRSEL